MLREQLSIAMVPTPAAEAEERIAALEKKYRELDALAKGLVHEILDLKSLVRNMAGRAGEGAGTGDVTAAGPDTAATAELSREEPAPAAPVDRIVIAPKGAKAQEPPKEPGMVRIMQPDGTFKLEPRRGDASTSSSASFDKGKKSTLFRNRKKQ